MTLDPAPYTADSVGLPTLLLALHDQVSQPLVFFLSFPASLCIVSAAAYAKYFTRIALVLYFLCNRPMTRYFRFTSFQLWTGNFRAIPSASVASQVHCIVLPPRWLYPFVDVLWHPAASICSFYRCCSISFFSKPKQPLFRHSVLPDDAFLSRTIYSVLSYHTKTSCRSFYSTTGGLYFIVCFARCSSVLMQIYSNSFFRCFSHIVYPCAVR